MYKILKLNAHGKEQLEHADYLAEYDAIDLDPSWVLFGIQPGQHVTWPQESANLHNFEVMKALLERRSSELWSFFTNGGLLVVRLVAPGTLEISGLREFLNSFAWWYETAYRASDHAIPPTWDWIQAGSGDTAQVLEPGHPFENYLRLASVYQARLTGNRARLISLAENRTGNPVAAEIACQDGALVLVPAPLHDGVEDLLDAAIQAALDSRVGVVNQWPVDEERSLSDQRDAILREMREKREDVDRQLVRSRERKAAVMKLVHVERAIGYFRKATDGVPLPKVAVPALWNMIEMLRDHYTKGYAQLAAMLDVPKDDLEFLNTLANNKALDLRHATSGGPTAVTPAEVQRARAIGKAVVAAVIDYEYSKASAAPAVAVGSNGEREEPTTA
jgi:hypothetical protein